MSGETDGIIPIPNGGVLQKGMAGLKQVVISMVIVLIAALILAAMVLYTVAVLRAVETGLLTGEPIHAMVQTDHTQPESDGLADNSHRALWDNCW